MNAEEHLDAIVRKCRQILEISEKRTPGRWRSDGPTISDRNSLHVAYANEYAASFGDGKDGHNARFIAASAGALEAACMATIAAIEMCRRHDWYAGRFVGEILAAWPEELLN